MREGIVMKFLKQLFCGHSGICINTETELNGSLLICKSIIKCTSCEKTFTQHPNSDCCYVKHLHSQILMEQMMSHIRSVKQ